MINLWYSTHSLRAPALDDSGENRMPTGKRLRAIRTCHYSALQSWLGELVEGEFNSSDDS